MGDIVQSVFGGSSSNSNQQSTQASGFNALPPAIQNLISSLATSGGSLLNPSGTPNSSPFTLPSLDPSANSALSQIANENFAITPQSIQSGIKEQMDPYQSSVIGQIENAQNGSLSQLNSYLTNSGTFGSNRGMLGASDISNVAANQVGGFLSGEFNNSLNNALTTIPQNQASSAQGAVQSGLLTQQQGLQNQQAPVSALAALANLFKTGIPQSSTGQSTGSSSSSSSPGIFNDLFGNSGDK